MGSILGAFAFLAGAISVALVARYGYVSSDTPIDGAIAAFFFSIAAIGGLGGHAVAVHLWRRNRGWAFITGVLALLALGINLSNTFEAILGRGDQTEAERVKNADTIKSAKRDLALTQEAMRSVPTYEPTTEATVKAAKAAADAATARREAECSGARGGRGRRCRDREADEATALAAVAKAETNFAATKRISWLIDRAARLRKKLDEAPATASPSPLATGLARLLQIPDAAAVSAATWQKFALAAIVELLIACAFVAFELMRADTPRRAPSTNSPKSISASVPRPRLVSEQTPAGNVHEYVVDQLEATKAATVSFRDVYVDYEAWCHGKEAPALAPNDFAERMAQICDGTDVYTRQRNETIQLVNVRIAGTAKPAVRRLGRMATVGVTEGTA